MADRNFCGTCEDDGIGLALRYDAKHCKTQKVNRGSNRLIAFRCDFESENILDPAEIIKGFEEGKIITTPCGNFNKTGTNTQVLFEYRCGGNEIDCVTHTFQFQTPIGAEDYSDELWWCRFNDEIGSRWNVAPLYCAEDRIVLPKEIVLAINAALLAEGDAAVVPYTGAFALNLTEAADLVDGPNNKNQVWQFTGEIEGGSSLISAEIPGLSAAISQAEAALAAPAEAV